MKRRLLCLAFCIVALCMMFLLTSCGPKGDETTLDKQARAVTITFNAIKGPGTTKEAIEFVQEEINKITETKLNIHVVLQFFDEEEYFAKVLDMIEKGPKQPEETKEPVETDEYGNEVGTDEQGRTIIIYPEVLENQVDIFLIRGYEDYKFLRDMQVLTDLTDAIKDSTDGIDKYFIKNIVNEINLIENETYFIPTNDIIGEYEYLLVNKELYDKYNHSLRNLDKFKTYNNISNIKPFLVDIATNEPDAIPLLNMTDLSAISFMGLKNYGSRFDQIRITDLKSEAAFKLDSILNDTLYTPNLELVMHLQALKKYKVSTEVSDTVDTSVKFGAAYIRGDKTVADKYKDDYYVVLTRAPYLTTEQLYDAGYAVSATSKIDPARCMELLNMMIKNEDIANLLAYGVPRVHYNINDSGMVFNRSGDYNFDFNYVPNKFHLYQNTEMTELELKYSANKWKLAKEQNGESGIHPYLNYVWQITPADKLYDFSLSFEENYQRLLDMRAQEQAIIAQIKELDDQVTAFLEAFSYNSTTPNGERAYTYNNASGQTVTQTLRQYITTARTLSTPATGPYKTEFIDKIQADFNTFWSEYRTQAQ